MVKRQKNKYEHVEITRKLITYPSTFIWGNSMIVAFKLIGGAYGPGYPQFEAVIFTDEVQTKENELENIVAMENKQIK